MLSFNFLQKSVQSHAADDELIKFWNENSLDQLTQITGCSRAFVSNKR